VKITNHYNLPEAVVKAIRNDPYDAGDSHYTVTQIVQPPRITLLMKRHWDKVEEDAIDRLWALLGQTVHEILSRAATDNALQEERIFIEVLGRKISGAPDLYHGDGLLQDFKVTSAWTAVYGSRLDEWTAQLNLYAHLLRRAGFPVRALEVVCLYRDWSATQAEKSVDYPQQPMEIISIPVWREEFTAGFLEGRVEQLIASEDLPDDALPECTPKEMWEKPTTYAVMRTGRKSALRIFEAEDEALRMVVEGTGTHVEVRPGARVRCERYCPVSRWCSQYQAYLAKATSQRQEEPAA
jgi:hypothetical protein